MKMLFKSLKCKLDPGPSRIGPVSIRERIQLDPDPIQTKKGVLTRGGPGPISDPRTHLAPGPGSNNRGFTVDLNARVSLNE